MTVPFSSTSATSTCWERVAGSRYQSHETMPAAARSVTSFTPGMESSDSCSTGGVGMSQRMPLPQVTRNRSDSGRPPHCMFVTRTESGCGTLTRVGGSFPAWARSGITSWPSPPT